MTNWREFGQGTLLLKESPVGKCGDVTITYHCPQHSQRRRVGRRNPNYPATKTCFGTVVYLNPITGRPMQIKLPSVSAGTVADAIRKAKHAGETKLESLRDMCKASKYDTKSKTLSLRRAADIIESIEEQEKEFEKAVKKHVRMPQRVSQESDTINWWEETQRRKARAAAGGSGRRKGSAGNKSRSRTKRRASSKRVARHR